MRQPDCSSVTLGNSLDLILFLDGVGVGAGADTLGGSDDLIGEALRKSLVGSERRLSGTLADQVDSLVDSSQRRDIDGLSADGTAGTDSGGVLTSTALDDGLEENLKRVATSEQVDNLKSLLEMTDGHLLLTVDAAISDHELVDKTLEDRAGNLLEALLLVLASGVRDVDLGLVSLDGKVVNEGVLGALNFSVSPLAEQSGLNSESVIYINFG